MEARDGPALSRREQQALTDIERELQQDEELDQSLRTMRLPRPRWLRSLRRRSRRDGRGQGSSAR